jgi:hypothetical protein
MNVPPVNIFNTALPRFVPSAPPAKAKIFTHGVDTLHFGNAQRPDPRLTYELVSLVSDRTLEMSFLRYPSDVAEKMQQIFFQRAEYEISELTRQGHLVPQGKARQWRCTPLINLALRAGDPEDRVSVEVLKGQYPQLAELLAQGDRKQASDLLNASIQECYAQPSPEEQQILHHIVSEYNAPERRFRRRSI